MTIAQIKEIKQLNKEVEKLMQLFDLTYQDAAILLQLYHNTINRKSK